MLLQTKHGYYKVYDATWSELVKFSDYPRSLHRIVTAVPPDELDIGRVWGTPISYRIRESFKTVVTPLG